MDVHDYLHGHISSSKTTKEFDEHETKMFFMFGYKKSCIFYFKLFRLTKSLLVEANKKIKQHEKDNSKLKAELQALRTSEADLKQQLNEARVFNAETCEQNDKLVQVNHHLRDCFNKYESCILHSHHIFHECVANIEACNLSVASDDEDEEEN